MDQHPLQQQPNTAPDNFQTEMPVHKSGKGWMIVAILAIVALVVVSAFSYYKWQQYKKLVGSLGADVNSLNAQVTTLNAQIQLMQKSGSSTGYRNVPELGVKYKLNNNTLKMTYEYQEYVQSGGNFKSIGMSTIELISEWAKAGGKTTDQNTCLASKGPIGSISKYQSGQIVFDKPVEQQVGENVKKIGDFYYVLSTPQSACSQNSTVNKTQTSSINISKEVFSLLEAI